jgi:hypothetical protein
MGSELILQEREQLIDLSSDETLHINFRNLMWSKFWISVKKEFPELSKKSNTFSTSFTLTHLCETA